MINNLPSPRSISRCRSSSGITHPTPPPPSPPQPERRSARLLFLLLGVYSPVSRFDTISSQLTYIRKRVVVNLY